jgi:hypothetical protein
VENREERSGKRWKANEWEAKGDMSSRYEKRER